MQGYSRLIKKNIGIERTPRVLQTEGIFDVPPTVKSEFELQIDFPLDEKEWNIGLIVGPSGSGKSSIIENLWPEYINKNLKWSKDACILDDFPELMPIKEITKLLQDVGFSSPPNWLKPFHVLSTGEKFRVTMARIIAEMNEFVVVDEFTSVIDRMVAKTASVCISKAIRKKKKKLIAVGCHYDIIDWLQPDWIYEPVGNIFKWRRLRRFPEVKLTVSRVHHKAWEIFKQYHYLTSSHIAGALCFVAFWDDKPVAFQSVINQPGKIKNRRRGHRIVVLPDYQGIGIGQALRNHIGSLLKANGLELRSRSAIPSLVYSSNKDPNWEIIEFFKHQLGRHVSKRFKALNRSTSMSRITSSFRYIGPSYPDKKIAKEMIYPSC